MALRILTCVDTLIDLVLGPGWNGNDEDFERRVDELRKLRELIDRDEVMIYIPASLVVILHMTVSIRFGVQHAEQAVRETLRIGTCNLNIDCDRLLEEALSVLPLEPTVELYETMLLSCANTIRADAIVVSQPYTLEQVVAHSTHEFNGFDIPIMSIGPFLRLLISKNENTITDDAIYVLTPQHRVIRLPHGATVIDFAYTIHTKIGDRCVGALVDGVEVLLDHQLRTGNVVEIFKDRKAVPDPAWLDFVVTRTAKRGINRGIKHCMSEKGWDIIKKTLGKNVRSYRQKLENIAEQLNCATNDLIIKIGLEEISPEQLMGLIYHCSQQIDEQVLSSPNQIQQISDADKRTWRLAFCCKPLPGDLIVGTIETARKSIRVHRRDCPNVERLNRERLQDISWNYNRFSMQLLIVLNDEPDTIRPILNMLVNNALTPNLRSLNVATDGTARASVGITVSSRLHLDNVIQLIQAMPRVVQVKVTKLTPV